jgi:16S rRNA (guanine527-N7)-methyltransferase
MKAAIIKQYFPSITEQQLAQFEQLFPLYAEWNEKINVISRKDIDNLMLHHVLHSLGGGFPGIPLAILFPEVNFHLVDSIGKKIKVVQGVADALGLKNVQATHGRAEDVDGEFEFVVSRAVTRLLPFFGWVKNKISLNSYHDLQNGLLCLKGGDLQEELQEFGRKHKVYHLSKTFKEDFFETKKLVHVAL